MYGNSPKELLNKINENSEIKINVLPFSILPIRVLNSLCNFVSRRFHNVLYREGVNHILIAINITPRNVLVSVFWILSVDHTLFKLISVYANSTAPETQTSLHRCL
jgi:hypothetical protein